MIHATNTQGKTFQKAKRSLWVTFEQIWKIPETITASMRILTSEPKIAVIKMKTTLIVSVSPPQRRSRVMTPAARVITLVARVITLVAQGARPTFSHASFLCHAAFCTFLKPEARSLKPGFQYQYFCFEYQNLCFEYKNPQLSFGGREFCSRSPPCLGRFAELPVFVFAPCRSVLDMPSRIKESLPRNRPHVSPG